MLDERSMSVHHQLANNTAIDPLSLGLLTTAWTLLMLLILALNVPMMYIFYATDQMQRSQAKYIFTMLLSVRSSWLAHAVRCSELLMLSAKALEKNIRQVKLPTDLLLALIIPLRLVGLSGLLAPYKTVCHGIQYLEQVLVTVNLYIILSLSLVRKNYISRGLRYRQGPTETNIFLLLIWIISLLCSARVPMLVGEPSFHDPDVPDALVCLSSIRDSPRVHFHEFIVDFIIPIFVTLFFTRSAKVYLSCQKLREVELAVRNKMDSRGVRMTLTLILFTALLHLPKHILIIHGFLQDASGRTFYMVQEAFQLLVYATGVSNAAVYLIFNRTSAPVFISFLKNQHHSLFFKDESVDGSVSDPSTSHSSSKQSKKYSAAAIHGPSDHPAEPAQEELTSKHPVTDSFSQSLPIDERAGATASHHHKGGRP